MYEGHAPDPAGPIGHGASADGRRLRAAAAALLIVHVALVARIGYVSSPTMDEAGHLPAGLSHWVSGRFDLYRVNPPLVRSLAAVPVLLARPRMDWSHYFQGPHARAEFIVGADFLSANGARSFWLFTLARWGCIPLSLVGAWTCYRWAGELYGPRCGLLALTLWCFDPNILANAAQITPDAGAAALGCLAGYAFWHWLHAPDWRRTVLAGLALGLAELTKTTWLVLFGLWPLLWLAWLARRRGAGAPCPTGPAPAKQAVRLGLILLLALYMINLGYGFEGTLMRLGDVPFISRALTGGGPPGAAGGNRFAGTVLGEVPIPLPANYIRGIDMQKQDFEVGLVSYLAGVQRQPGWWYYYLYAAAVKVPLGTWLLGAIALALTLRGRGSAAAADELVLWAPALAVLVLVSSQTGFNRHFRYILPALPFALIWASKSGRVIDGRHRAGSACVLLAAAGSVASSLAVYPHSLSYFNEAVGGPIGGPAHLLDSNIDWGQDLLHLKRWLDVHPEAAGLKLAYFGPVPPRLAGIDAPLPPRGPMESGEDPDRAGELGPQPGWFAVSVNYVYGYHHGESDGPYFTYFRAFKPVAMAGYSIYIYHITRTAADEARRRLGLPRSTTSALSWHFVRPAAGAR
jgi:Dolichyl-phosphate-mannose-protein mannosyltransferase